MKLWQKIALICSAVLLLTALVMGAMLLAQARGSILDMVYAQAKDKQHNLAVSFSEMTTYYSDDGDPAAVEYALVNYCFSRFADGNSVLIHGGETLFSKLSIRPAEYLPLEDGKKHSSQEQYTGTIDGRQILIVGSSVELRGQVYSVYVAEDITEVYVTLRQMAWRFVLTGGCGIAVGVLLIILLVHCSMRPLGKLKSAAGRIADGHYGERANIRSRDEVGALAGDFNRMAEAVENHIGQLTETAERQRLFIGAVTHEMKTPLTAMMLNADTLQNTYMTEEERQTALGRIVAQCRWLEHMAQNLLKLIVARESIQVKPASVPALFARVEESMAERLRMGGIELITECAPEAKLQTMDAELMQTALMNLVDNGAKASAPGQRVVLRAYGNVLEVSDAGKGIPAEEIPRVTEPFYMVDRSRSKKAGGTGLGLALVREIVEAHGASLSIESPQGGGTVVRITFR